MPWTRHGSTLQYTPAKSENDDTRANEDSSNVDWRENKSCLPIRSGPHVSTKTLTRSTDLKPKRISAMGLAIRNKLRKDKPLPQITVTKSEDDIDSWADWSSGDESKVEVASRPIQGRNSHSEYLNIPPPPKGILKSRAGSPSLSVPSRPQNRSVGQEAMATPLVNAAKNADSNINAESTSPKERCDSGRLPTPPGKSDSPANPENGPPKETKRVNGVNFEMMSRRSPTSSIASCADEDLSSTNERRQTRSQTRRQERSDSHNSLLQPSVTNHVQGLTIRKVRDAERTPSPRTKPDENETTPDSPDELTLSQLKKDLEDKTARPLPSPPTSEESSSTRSRLPVSSNSNIATTRPKLSSYRRSQNSKYDIEHGLEVKVEAKIEPTIVTPPMYNSQVPATYLWVSSLSSSSRPGAPWGWTKKWTCCQCADLDPWGRDEPAQTIVEQKICSRVECGHERCRQGCRI